MNKQPTTLCFLLSDVCVQHQLCSIFGNRGRALRPHSAKADFVADAAFKGVSRHIMTRWKPKPSTLSKDSVRNKTGLSGKIQKSSVLLLTKEVPTAKGSNLDLSEKCEGQEIGCAGRTYLVHDDIVDSVLIIVLVVAHPHGEALWVIPLKVLQAHKHVTGISLIQTQQCSTQATSLLN